MTFADFEFLGAEGAELIWGLRHGAVDCRITFWQDSPLTPWAASYVRLGQPRYELIDFDTPEEAVTALRVRVRV